MKKLMSLLLLSVFVIGTASVISANADYVNIEDYYWINQTSNNTSVDLEESYTYVGTPVLPVQRVQQERKAEQQDLYKKYQKYQLQEVERYVPKYR